MQEAVIVNEYCMRIAVCDDDPQDLTRVESLTWQIAEQEGLRCEVSAYINAESLLAAIQDGQQYQLLLLDVVMDRMSGMALASALRARQDQTAIVFISSNLDMALSGYEVAASRFLAKPVQEDKLREALLFCYRSCSAARQEIVLPTSRGARRLLPSEIIWAETWGRGVRITLQDGTEELNLKISDLERMLPARQFVLCHRAFLVNLDYVRYLRHCELELKTGDVLPVSKYRQNATRDKLMNYLES